MALHCKSARLFNHNVPKRAGSGAQSWCEQRDVWSEATRTGAQETLCLQEPQDLSPAPPGPPLPQNREGNDCPDTELGHTPHSIAEMATKLKEKLSKIRTQKGERQQDALKGFWQMICPAQPFYPSTHLEQCMSPTWEPVEAMGTLPWRRKRGSKRGLPPSTPRPESRRSRLGS